MGEEMFGLISTLSILLCVSTLEIEGWKITRKTEPVHTIHSKTLSVDNLGISEQPGKIVETKSIRYNPFIFQDASKIVPTNMDPHVGNAKNLFIDPGTEISYTIVIPNSMVILLDELFDKSYRDFVLSFLDKYTLKEIIFRYGGAKFHNILTDQQIQSLRIFKQYAKQQSYVKYNILGKEKRVLKYLHELMVEFNLLINSYLVELYNHGGDGKPDKHTKIWKYPSLSNYPQDFSVFMQKYPSILVLNSPKRKQTLKALVTDLLEGMDISQLIGNPLVQHKYPPQLLDVVLKLYGIPVDKQIKILYKFLRTLRDPDMLMRYIYMLFNLSRNEKNVYDVYPEIVIVSEDRDNIIKNVIHYLLANPDMTFILNNPKEQHKYPQDLVSVLIKVYNSRNKEEQYSILTDFLNNQNNPKIFMDLITKLYEIIGSQPNKKDGINGDPNKIKDLWDSKTVIINKIYDIVNILDISSLLRNPTMLKSFPPELLEILFKIQNTKNENQKHYTLYAFLIKQNDPNILMEYLKVLYTYLLQTHVKEDEGNDIVYVPSLDNELIEKIIKYLINNQNILNLAIDSNVQQKYPTELLDIILKLQNINDKKQKFQILYEFVIHEKDPRVLIENLRLLIELANKTQTKPDENMQPEIVKVNFDDEIFNLIMNLNLTSVITDIIEQKKYPHELLNILIEINKIGDPKRQFEILYEFLINQNDLNLLLEYVYLLLDLSGNRENIKGIDFPIGIKCSADTMGKHDCMDCVCSNNDSLACVIYPNCDQAPKEDPVVMLCKPYSKFQLDECSTCECNRNGVPICTISECSTNIVIEKPLKCRPHSKYQLDECNSCECSEDGVPVCDVSECSSQDKLDIALRVITLVIEDGLVCPPEKGIPSCAPDTNWIDKCYECTCNSFGRRSCVRIPECAYWQDNNMGYRSFFKTKTLNKKKNGM